MPTIHWTPRPLGQVLAAMARQYPDQEALVIESRRLSFAQLWLEAGRAARALKALGVQRGDHVAICMGNTPDWVTLFLGAGLIGAVTVPVNTRFKAEELRYCLSQSDSTVLVMADRFLKIDFVAMLREICPGIDHALPDSGLPRLRHVVVLGDDVPKAAMDYRTMLEASGAPPFDPAAEPVTPDDVLLMQYTSGSTSFPKGVMLSHDGMLRNATCVADRIGITAGDRYYSARPFYHVAGSALAILACLVKAACLLSSPHFDVAQALRILAEEGCTLTGANETMFLMMLAHPDVGRYRYQVRGGWGVGGPDTVNRVIARFGMHGICSGYGLSEASPNVWMSRHDDPLPLRLQGFGIPHAGLETRIVDLQTAQQQPAGTPGELLVRGWSLMKGYYNMPEATAKAIDADGWLHTGDICVADEAGRMRFVGRAKEMLRVGGENVAPADVENTLQSHPAVAQAQVVGVPDPRMGEVPVAYVVLKDGAAATESELLAWGKARMANFKAPRHVRIIDTFERIGMTGSFKVQKNKLREHALSDLGMTEGKQA